MVIKFSAAFSLRCVNCGCSNINRVNIFELNPVKKYECKCGEQIVEIKKSGKNIEFNIICMLCDYKHTINISQNKFWSDTLNNLVCPQTNRKIGYFGTYKKIKDILNREEQDLKAMANKSGLDDFKSPEIVLDILDYLHDIAARENLYCECGSHNIYIDLFSDSIKIFCNFCDNFILIPATDKKELEKVKSFKEIILSFSNGENSDNPKDPWINI